MLGLTVQSKAVLPEKNLRQNLNLQMLTFISHLNQIRNQEDQKTKPLHNDLHSDTQVATKLILKNKNFD